MILKNYRLSTAEVPCRDCNPKVGQRPVPTMCMRNLCSGRNCNEVSCPLPPIQGISALHWSSGHGASTAVIIRKPHQLNSVTPTISDEDVLVFADQPAPTRVPFLQLRAPHPSAALTKRLSSVCPGPRSTLRREIGPKQHPIWPSFLHRCCANLHPRDAPTQQCA